MSDIPILGVDIGGTKCAVALGTRDGRILARKEMPTRAEAGPGDVIERLTRLAGELVRERLASPSDLEGIGISCGGPLDTTTGIVYSPPNLPGWEGIPVRALFERAFPGVRVVLENDANATALAEWMWGAGRGTRNVVYLTQGTGIGGGLMRDLMAGDTPELLRPGQYNTLLVILAALFYLLVTQHTPLTRIQTAWLTIGLFFAARLLTIRFNWRTRPLHDFHVSEVVGGVAEWIPWGRHK